MKNKLKELSKLNQQNGDAINCAQNSAEDANSAVVQSKQSAHRAGYDAFMTGYCFASFLLTAFNKEIDFNAPLNAKRMGISHFVNNLYLTSKDVPLRVSASTFAKTSSLHKNKLSKLRETNKT